MNESSGARAGARIGVGRARLAAAASMLLLAAGCSFDKEWRAAQHCCYPGDSLAGAWEGTWESQCNGHHGTLRAVFTPCGPNTYHARYRATFCGFIPYCYDTTYVTCDSCGASYFQGQVDLGRCAGGNYSYWGMANGRMFESGYLTVKDEGVYRMRKVGECCHSGCGAATCSGFSEASPSSQDSAPDGPPHAPPEVTPPPPATAPPATALAPTVPRRMPDPSPEADSGSSDEPGTPALPF